MQEETHERSHAPVSVRYILSGAAENDDAGLKQDYQQDCRESLKDLDHCASLEHLGEYRVQGDEEAWTCTCM